MSDTESETWAPVPGYEGLYEVSDQGRVRSIGREVHVSPHGRKGYDRPVEEGSAYTYNNKDDVLMVGLHKNGEETSRSVARLVLLAHGPEPESPKRHAKRIDPDGDPCLENLEWVRPIHKSKLTEEEAARIYKWAWQTSMTNKKVGRHFGVSPQTVSNIKCGYKWTHVTDEIAVDKR
jgi:hypothetical protein